MAQIQIRPCAKLILSQQDRAALRTLIIDEIDFAEKVQSKEETIRHATASIMDFLESRSLEITNNN